MARDDAADHESGLRNGTADTVFAPAHVLAQAIHHREVSPVEVVEAYLARIARRNRRLNAVVTLDEEGASQRAQEADDALVRGEVWGSLHGVPFTLEDGHPTSGVRSTWGGLPRLAEHIPEEDDAAFQNLLTARNSSILAHGVDPIGQRTAEKFLQYLDLDTPQEILEAGT